MLIYLFMKNDGSATLIRFSKRRDSAAFSSIFTPSLIKAIPPAAEPDPQAGVWTAGTFIYMGM